MKFISILRFEALLTGTVKITVSGYRRQPDVSDEFIVSMFRVKE
jgi:hypothetical protein